MYSTKPGYIIAFHGCDEDIRNQIVMGDKGFKASMNDYDWLGNGMYFWEYNHQRAYSFALDRQKHPKSALSVINKAAVLGAVIELKNCLDLLDSKFLDLVKSSYNNYQDSYKMLGHDMPKNVNVSGSKDRLLRRLDCAVIENLHTLNTENPFDSVRGVFIEGDPLYEGAGFNEKNHIQICVRNPNCIKAFFIPRETVKWPKK